MRIGTRLVGWLGLALLASAQAAPAATVTVTEFAPITSVTPGVWKVSDARTGTTGSTVSTVLLADEPAYGDLQSAAPLGAGAAKLTTANDVNSMGEVGVYNNFGTVSDLLSNTDFSVSYSFLAHAGPNGVSAPGSAPAPALKLQFRNGAQSVTLVYEPYYQGLVTQDDWTTATINATTGKFWSGAGFGQPSQGGGAYATNKTLAEWAAVFNASSGGAFSGAQLVGVRIGMGTYNWDQTGYFDAVTLNGVAGGSVTYDFEPTPEPSTLALGAIAAGLFGVQALRRRRARA